MSNTISRDFSKQTIKALSAKGIKIVGVTSYKVEYQNGSWGYERAYNIDDNGFGRVWTAAQVEKAAD